jgi:hypothetical protein
MKAIWKWNSNEIVSILCYRTFTNYVPWILCYRTFTNYVSWILSYRTFTNYVPWILCYRTFTNYVPWILCFFVRNAFIQLVGKSHSHEACLILYNLNLTRVAENSQSCTFLCCLIIFLITYKNWIIVYKHVYQLCTFSDDVNRKVICLQLLNIITIT